MRILEQSALDNTEYLACLSAFCTALENHVGETENYLVRLAGKHKGVHFGWEMAMDRARYGALIVLERWKELNERFAESLRNTASSLLAEAAPAKCDTAAEGLQAAYLTLDSLEEYSEPLVRAAIERARTVLDLFASERQQVRAFHPEMTALNVLGSGPSPADLFRRTRESFLADLTRR